jgi:5-methylcytosine-specific restriction endonuclease McrA
MMGAGLEPLPTWAYLDILNSGTCVYCGAEPTHVDHVWALSRGGPHCAWNLVPSCARCNQSKGGKLLSELRSRTWLQRIEHALGVSESVRREWVRLRIDGASG